MHGLKAVRIVASTSGWPEYQGAWPQMSAVIVLCVVIVIEAHLVLLLFCDHWCWQEPITDLVTSRLEREHAAMADR